MKKYILATLFLGLFVLFLEPAETLLSNFLRIEQPTVHEVEDGDWLSKIALKYYGDPTFWQELELINRVPEGNLVFPGEKVIVPSFKIIQQIRNTKKLSEVNKLIKEQQNILISTSVQPNNHQEVEKSQPEKTVTRTAKESAKFEIAKDVGRIIDFEQQLAESSPDQVLLTSSIPLAAVVALGLGLVVAILYFIRKKRAGETTYYGADLAAKKSESDKSIYLDGFEEHDTAGNEEPEIQTEAEKKEMQVV